MLVGLVPGVTLTVSVMLPPASTWLGVAEVVADGSVCAPLLHGFAVDELLRAVGVATVKSLALLPLLVQPLPLRIAAVELVNAAGWIGTVAAAAVADDIDDGHAGGAACR